MLHPRSRNGFLTRSTFPNRKPPTRYIPSKPARQNKNRADKTNSKPGFAPSSTPSTHKPSLRNFYWTFPTGLLRDVEACCGDGGAVGAGGEAEPSGFLFDHSCIAWPSEPF